MCEDFLSNMFNPESFLTITDVFLDNQNEEVVKIFYKTFGSKKKMNFFLFCQSRIWKYYHISTDYNDWINKYEEIQFYNLYRMETATFERLVTTVIENDQYGIIKKKYRSGNFPVEPAKSVLIFVWYMAGLDSLNSCGDKFGVAPSTVMQIVNAVLYILVRLKNKYIFWPRMQEEFQHIENEFISYPGVVGAIDGTHIFLKVPSKQHDSYVDRYMRHSINLMAICAATKMFTYVYIGFPGSAHDARVFSNSSLAVKIEQEGPNKYFGNIERYHLIGDSAFPLRVWLMKPYKQNRLLTRMERHHNWCLSSARIVIEHAFGMLKGRWRRFQFINVYNVAKAIEIVTAACVLHNFCLLNVDDWKDIEEADDHFEEDEEVDRDLVAQHLGRQKRNNIALHLIQ